MFRGYAGSEKPQIIRGNIVSEPSAAATKPSEFKG